MLPFTLINPLPIVISLSAITGILWHDTSLDKVTAAMTNLPAMYVSYGGTSESVYKFNDAHVHVERTVAGAKDIRVTNPRLQPRTNEDKKYRVQRSVGRGHYAFGNVDLPLV